MSVVRQEFDALAGDYETNRLAPWYRAHADLILERLPPLEHGLIVDVGCATGYLLRRYLRRYPGASGLGVDVAPAMIEQAERLAREDGVDNARFMTADWETIDPAALTGQPARIVVCANAFHYFASPEAAALRLWEILDEGGLLYVLERDKSRSALTLLWGWLHRHFIKDNVEFYTRDELTSFVTRAGFRDVAVVQSINRLLWKRKLYTSIVLLECRKA